MFSTMETAMTAIKIRGSKKERVIISSTASTIRQDTAITSGISSAKEAWMMRLSRTAPEDRWGTFARYCST